MLHDLWGYLVGLGALIAAFFGFFFYAKRQGEKEEQSAQTQKSLEQAKESNEIDDRVHRMSDGELDEQLRNVRRKE